MPPDLYGDLGISRGASAAEVRKAYRRAAKRAHPDAGGSPEKFHRIRTALLVLTDDARRQRYDETGQFDADQPADNALAEKIETASYVLDQTLGRLINAGRDLKTVDVIAEMRRTIVAMRADLDKQLQAFEETIGKYRTLRGRFTVAKPVDEPNRLEQIIAGKIGQIEHMVSVHQNRKTRLATVDEMLGEYRYRQDAAPPQGADARMIQMLQQAYQGFGR
jgi:curved DNA-binding protein CbpA